MSRTRPLCSFTDPRVIILRSGLYRSAAASGDLAAHELNPRCRSALARITLASFPHSPLLASQAFFFFFLFPAFAGDLLNV